MIKPFHAVKVLACTMFYIFLFVNLVVDHFVPDEVVKLPLGAVE